MFHIVVGALLVVAGLAAGTGFDSPFGYLIAIAGAALAGAGALGRRRGSNMSGRAADGVPLDAGTEGARSRSNIEPGHY